MGVARRAVREHERRLPRPAGPTRALRVVRRRRRDVAQAHRVQARDVDAEFHRRRAVQQRQRALPEGALALLALRGTHLRGVLARRQAAQLAGHPLVEGAEEGVDAAAGVGVHGLADRVGGGARAVPGGPDQRGRLQPVAAASVVALDLGEEPGPGENAEDVLDDALGVVDAQLVGVAGELVRAGQVATQRGAAGQVQVVAALARLAGERVHDADRGDHLVGGNGPHAGELLRRLALDPLEAKLGQAVDVDGEHLAELVQDDPAQLLAMPVPRVAQRLQRARPQGLVGGDLGEGFVAHVQQAGLLEVRHRDAPAALQVEVEPVLHQFAQCPLGARLGRVHGVRGGGVVGELQAQGVHHLGGDALVGQAVRRRLHGGVQGAAELGDLDEVVEVAGLQAGVLPVVDEGQQLAGLGGQLGRGDLAQGAHQARRQHRDRRTAALGVQGDQLGEVTAAGLLVADLAGQAERERRRDERRRCPAHVHEVTGRVDANSLWQVAHPVGQGLVVGAHPRVGQATLGDGIGRPRQLRGHVQVAVDRIARGDVARCARGVGRLALPGDRLDDGVLLPALAAERQREQQLLRGRGDGDLVLRGDEPVLLRLQRHVQRVALGQELVQPEREQGASGLGVAHLRALQERPLDRVVTVLHRKTRQLRQRRRGVLAQPAGYLPDQHGPWPPRWPGRTSSRSTTPAGTPPARRSRRAGTRT